MLLRVDEHGDVWLELSRLVDHRPKLVVCGDSWGGGGCCVPPRLPSDVVFELSPLQRAAEADASDRRLRSRKPSRGAGAFLYHSGTLSFCNDLWTRNSCSESTRSEFFCSSFSGGCTVCTLSLSSRNSMDL